VGLKYIQTKSEFAWVCCSHIMWTKDSKWKYYMAGLFPALDCEAQPNYNTSTKGGLQLDGCYLNKFLGSRNHSNLAWYLDLQILNNVNQNMLYASFIHADLESLYLIIWNIPSDVFPSFIYVSVITIFLQNLKPASLLTRYASLTSTSFSFLKLHLSILKV